MIKLIHIVLQIVASAIMRGIKTKSHLNVSYFGLTEYKYCVKGNIHSHFIFAFSPWRIQNIFFRTVLIRKSIMFNCLNELQNVVQAFASLGGPKNQNTAVKNNPVYSTLSLSPL